MSPDNLTQFLTWNKLLIKINEKKKHQENEDGFKKLCASKVTIKKIRDKPWNGRKYLHISNKDLLSRRSKVFLQVNK